MLIKRNVYFSAIDQETGEERLFSLNEILTEEEYLERLCAESEDSKMSSRKKAAIAAGTVAGIAAAIYGGKKLGRALETSGSKILNNAHVNPGKLGSAINTAKVKTGRAMQAPADFVVGVGRSAGSVTRKGADKVANSKAVLKAEGYAEDAARRAREAAFDAKEAAKRATDKAKKVISRDKK